MCETVRFPRGSRPRFFGDRGVAVDGFGFLGLGFVGGVSAVNVIDARDDVVVGSFDDVSVDDHGGGDAFTAGSASGRGYGRRFLGLVGIGCGGIGFVFVLLLFLNGPEGRLLLVSSGLRSGPMDDEDSRTVGEGREESLPSVDPTFGLAQVDAVDGDDGIAHLEGSVGIALTFYDALIVQFADVDAEGARGQGYIDRR